MRVCASSRHLFHRRELSPGTPASKLAGHRSLGSPVSEVIAWLAMLHGGLRTHARALVVTSVSQAICSAAGN